MISRRRILTTSISMLLLGNVAIANEVSNFDELNNSLKNNADEILLINSIESTGNYEKQISPELTIDANNKTLNGNNYQGFYFDYGSKLNIKSVEMKDFKTGGCGATIKNNGILTIHDSTFHNNEANQGGGAIHNRTDSTANIYNSIFQNNFANSTYNGGAIYNDSYSSTNLFNSELKYNHAQYGGAFYNGEHSIININSSSLLNNLANSYGGAIYNETEGVVNIKNSTISGNNSGVLGGALYNAWLSTINIYNSTFKNNSTTTKGGAIYNEYGIVNIFAEGADTRFEGNTANNVPNAIYNEAIDINVYASSNNNGMGKIIFNDGIAGDGSFNINKEILSPPEGISKTHNGTVVFNSDMSDFNGTTNLYNGTIKIGSNIKNNTIDGYTNFVKGDFNIIGTNTFLDTQNGIIDNFDTQNWNFTNNLNTKIDVDLKNEKADFFSNLKTNQNGIVISNINLLNDKYANNIAIAVSEPNKPIYLSQQAKTIYSPIYKYTVSDCNLADSGLLIFSSTGSNEYNPAIFTAPTAAEAGIYINQLTSYSQAFNSMDSMMNLPLSSRLALKYKNKYALSENPIFGKSRLDYNSEDYAGLWFTPYASFENVRFNSGQKVSTTSYGSYFGGDSNLISLKRGWDVIYSAYASYNGSHQTYQGNGIYQNGGQLGATSTFYKNNYFVGLTANVGASVCEASTMYGKESFNVLNSGAALKSGYNFEFEHGKYIIQPSYMMSYTFVNTFDYTNAANIRITSDPLNAIQIVPGLKFIANMKNSWQPYLGVEMYWNLMDKAKFYANDVSLPALSIKPYVQYGVGVQKRIGKRCTGFGQAMLRNGGRTGIALSFGFNWSIGKDNL